MGGPENTGIRGMASSGTYLHTVAVGQREDEISGCKLGAK